MSSYLIQKRVSLSIEQYGELVKAKEMYRKGQSENDPKIVSLALAVVAAYLSRADLSNCERVAAEKLKNDMDE